ncbi:MAG TPA: glycosyltransferase family A protein [Burkholderiaceae bacterium]|nr:glycosyltransferase family A protein [Burkholderiaceae bacterium]
MTLPPYVIVSPVRDEAEHLGRTIESIAAQEHRPAEGVIVDDGSTDSTPAIASAAAAEHDWIRVITRPGRATAARGRGKPIVEAFNAGLDTVTAAHEFVVKMDGDLFVPPHYFDWVARTFAHYPRAGIVGGFGLVPDGNEWVPDQIGRHNVAGYIKAYRRTCLDEIGGLQASMGWDGIDEYSARARGWTSHPLSELVVLHYRRRGARQKWWRARWDEGEGNAFMGYLPSFVVLRAGYRGLVERPPILSGIVLFAGWAWSRLTRRPQVPDPAAREELRREQRARLRRRGATASPTEPGPAFFADRD